MPNGSCRDLGLDYGYEWQQQFCRIPVNILVYTPRPYSAKSLKRQPAGVSRNGCGVLCTFIDARQANDFVRGCKKKL